MQWGEGPQPLLCEDRLFKSNKNISDDLKNRNNNQINIKNVCLLYFLFGGSFYDYIKRLLSRKQRNSISLK